MTSRSSTGASQIRGTLPCPVNNCGGDLSVMLAWDGGPGPAAVVGQVPRCRGCREVSDREAFDAGLRAVAWSVAVQAHNDRLDALIAAVEQEDACPSA